MISLEQLQSAKYSNSKAYILGLLITKINISQINPTDKLLISGGISHNKTSVPKDYDNKIATHHLSFNQLCLADKFPLESLIFKNNELPTFSAKSNYTKKRKSNKLGFSVVFTISQFNQDNISIEKVNKLRLDIIEMVNQIPKEYCKYFIAALIDGKGSKDTTYQYLSLDVESNEKTVEAINNTLNKANFILDLDYKWNFRNKQTHLILKSDQLRFKPATIYRIINEIPLLSLIRKNILLQGN